MKKLPPGVTFEYKNENGYTYGAPKGTDDWSLIGRMITDEDHKLEGEFTKIRSYIFDDANQYKKRFNNFVICSKALAISESNPSLQEAIERVKSLYYMTVKNDT